MGLARSLALDAREIADPVLALMPRLVRLQHAAADLVELDGFEQGA